MWHNLKRIFLTITSYQILLPEILQPGILIFSSKNIVHKYIYFCLQSFNVVDFGYKE